MQMGKWENQRVNENWGFASSDNHYKVERAICLCDPPIVTADSLCTPREKYFVSSTVNKHSPILLEIHSRIFIVTNSDRKVFQFPIEKIIVLTIVRIVLHLVVRDFSFPLLYILYLSTLMRCYAMSADVTTFFECRYVMWQVAGVARVLKNKSGGIQMIELLFFSFRKSGKTCCQI